MLLLTWDTPMGLKVCPFVVMVLKDCADPGPDPWETAPPPTVVPANPVWTPAADPLPAADAPPALLVADPSTLFAMLELTPLDVAPPVGKEKEQDKRESKARVFI